VSVVTPGSPTKKPYSAVASSLSNAFKGAFFADRKSTGARYVALEKEGKLCVQVLYPDNLFTAVVSFTTLYIKVVHCKGGKVVPACYCNTIFFTAVIKDFLKSASGIDLGYEWLN
jgi:hypothetical protein